MSSEWLELDYFLLATSSFIGTVVYYLSRKDNKAILNLQKVPNVEVGLGLQSLIKNQTTLPYVAIRGATKELSSQILASETGLKGVLQIISVNEHSVKRYSNGLWGDSVREIVHTSNEVPFGLRSMMDSGSNTMIVEIVDPSLAIQQNLLSPVSTKFTPAVTGFASTVFSLFAGNAATGIETTEKLLPIDTNVTAVGQLVATSGKLRLTIPSNNSNFPYIISMYPLEHIIETMTNRRRGLRIIAGIFYTLAVALAVRRGWKLWKTYEEKRMRTRIQRERAERTAANRAHHTGGLGIPIVDTNANPDVHLCIICLTNPREVILLPCGHVVLCADCLEQLDRTCPVCRNSFTGTHVAYIS